MAVDSAAFAVPCDQDAELQLLLHAMTALSATEKHRCRILIHKPW